MNMNRYFEQLIGAFLGVLYWCFNSAKAMIAGAFVVDWGEVLTALFVGIAGAIGGLIVKWLKRKMLPKNTKGDEPTV